MKFAGTYIEIDGEVVSKITSVSNSYSTSEEDITGSEDKNDINTLFQKFSAIAINTTFSIEGISMDDSEGQNRLKQVAQAGENTVLRCIRRTGHGMELHGFFTSYEESGSTSGVYRFSGTFRINRKYKITPTTLGFGSYSFGLIPYGVLEY